AAKIAAEASSGKVRDMMIAPIAEEDTAGAVGNEASIFFRPRTIADLCLMKSEHPDADLLAGGTDLGLGVAQAKERWPMAILTAAVPEMLEIETIDDHLVFGGAVTWQRALPHIEKHWPSFATLIRRFGSSQVRAMGTIAGNIGNASPIGDGPPALMALGAGLVLASVHRERDIRLDEFFTGYRQTVMDADEVITKITIPLPGPDEHFRVYKISKRYDQDISTVCGAFHMAMQNNIVSKARIAFGGMAATSQRCPSAEKTLVGKALSPEVVSDASGAIDRHFSPMTDGRGSAGYRSTVAANLVERFIRDISGETIEVMAL
ncbi:MAG: xanthine dehydrogenase small subunit, partial [Hyphomicrobiales bacterium]|nr:xanthine dehydrogenase small subunit [Hyphomicrobiales bacterium]